MKSRRSDAPGTPGNNLQHWGCIKDAATYAGVSPDVLRSWIRRGLIVSRPTHKTCQIRFTHVDDFLEQFQVSTTDIQALAKDIIKSIKA